jgi:hypothetical protein
MLKLDTIDVFLLVIVLCLSVWVMGFTMGHDIAVVQQESILFMDRLNEIAQAIDSLNR